MIPAHRPLLDGGVVLVAILVVIGLGTMSFVGPVAATDDANDANNDDVKKIASFDVTIDDEEFVIGDVHLKGPGLPNEEINEQTYIIESATITGDGVTFTVQDTTYNICSVSIVIEDVSFTLQNVTLGDTS